MRVITFGNQKGGCGKTTGVQLFANVFSQAPMGLKILVLDLDTQITITESRWGDLKNNTAAPAYDVLTMDIADGISFFKNHLDEVVQGSTAVDEQGRACFQSNYNRTVKKPGGISVDIPKQLLYLHQSGHTIYETYDLILVDMPGTIMAKAQLAPMLAISDGIMIPFKATEKDMRSTISFIKVVNALRRVRKDRGLELEVAAYINEHRDTLKFRKALKLDRPFEKQEVQLFETSLRVRDLYSGLGTMMPSLLTQANKRQGSTKVKQWAEIRHLYKEWAAFYEKVCKNASLMDSVVD